MPQSEFAPARFQSFDVRTSRATVAPRLKALRAELAADELSAFLIPRADAHRGESVPPGEARLAYVTSFTGSAGLAVVGLRRAGLFVDGRYTLQAPAETDTRRFTIIETASPATSPRLRDFVEKGGRVGYDPWLHTPGEISQLRETLGEHADLVAVEHNPVDRIWKDRPPAPVTPVEFLGANRAGRSAADKLADLRGALAAEGADAVVLTLPESICWLFNMRGRDVPNTPFVLAFAIVPRRGLPTVFVKKRKQTPELRRGLAGVSRIASADRLIPTLQRLAAADRRIMADPATCPGAIIDAIRAAEAGTLVERADPVLLPKARKNEVEISGMREAHKRDGVAMARFLCWFDSEAHKGGLDEIGIATALESFRRDDETLVDISFDTIAGAGPNGAIVHYRVSGKTNRKLKPGELMLLDSGGQYLMGTTDITRTISTGRTTAEQRDRYTRVLKGMMAISMARFPRGTTGAQIDVLARQFLWADGVTYNHGTGHGVGHFLSVHEGPAGISPRYTVPLEPGMIISNEPGYYKQDAYGIRIENLVLVTQSSVGEGRFLEFETLTLCPIDLRLIETGLLTPDERDWLNAYHRRVWREIGPAVKGAVKAWLREATRPI